MTNDTPIPVTVVIPAKNEEENLRTCLDGLKRFQQVVVIDSCSTDGTADIARNWGAELIEFTWNGKFPKKRNWYLMNFRPECEWVLFLDADEVVTEDFVDQISVSIERPDIEAYWLRYTNHFLGRALRYGDPQRKLALFKHGSAFYERIDEVEWSHLDMEVHEHPIIEGLVGEIQAKIDHCDFRGLPHFIKRHVEYALWESRRALSVRRRTEEWRALTSRQRAKYRSLDKWWFPAAYFAYSYLFRLGFLDGRAGLAYAICKAWYFYTIRLLLLHERRPTS